MNVVDLLALQNPEDHPHGVSSEEFDQLFTRSRPVVFFFHGYPTAIHELVHHRPNPTRFHVGGYIEEGTTEPPFQLLVDNGVSRYHLAIRALQRTTGHASAAGRLIEEYTRRIHLATAYVRRARHGPSRDHGVELVRRRMTPDERAHRQPGVEQPQARRDRPRRRGRRRGRPHHLRDRGSGIAGAGIDRDALDRFVGAAPPLGVAAVRLVHGGTVARTTTLVDDDVRARLGAVARPRAAAQPALARRARRTARAVPDDAAGRVRRHRVPRDDPRRRCDLRRPVGLDYPARHPQVRLPRPEPRLREPARRRAPGRGRRTGSGCAS